MMQGLKKSNQIPDFQGKSQVSITVNKDYAVKKQGGIVNSGKCRRSRWDRSEGDEHTDEHDNVHKVRKTRWDSIEPKLRLPGSGTVPLGYELDPEVEELKAELLEIDEKLHKPELYDDRAQHERSPSPEPLYNNSGTRVNTREMRLRQKLVLKRLDIITRLVKKNPDSRQKLPSSKLCEKLFIPEKEYPGYNFIGLILGPQGNTLKRMERESGAKIVLRGKGSSLKGIEHSSDLHVRIEACDKESLDAAVQMVKKLLVPVAEGMNEHKRAQLAELARLRKDANGCTVCGKKDHREYCCPNLQSDFMSMSCDSCGSDNYLTTLNKPNKRADDVNLYVGYLPQFVDETRLKELFSPFGKLTEARVIRDQTTGLSKGYGFVKFEIPTDAAAAVTHLNGYKIDGKMLAVRVTGKSVLGPSFSVGNPLIQNPAESISVIRPPPSVGHPLIPNPGPAALSQIIPGHVAWPVPHGSLVPEDQASLPQSESMNMFQASCYGGNTQVQPKSRGTGLFPAPCISSLHDPSSASGLCSENSVSFSSPSSIASFPGNPVYVSSKIIPDRIAWPGPSGSLIPEHEASFRHSSGRNLFQASCYGRNTQLQPKSPVLGLTPLGTSSFHDPSSRSGLRSKDGVSFSLSSSNDWFPGNLGYGSNSSQFEPYLNKPRLESTPALLLSERELSNLKPIPWPTSHQH